MRLNRLAMIVGLAAAAFATLPALNATAGQTSVNVMVTARLIPSSGVCSLATGGAAVGVTCGGGGTVPPVPDPAAPITTPAPPPWVAPGPHMPNDGEGSRPPAVPQPIATPGPTVPGSSGPPISFPGSPPERPPVAAGPQTQPALQVLAGFNQWGDLRYVGRVAYAGEGFSLYSASAEITSWRVVSLDNGKYVELTIAW